MPYASNSTSTLAAVLTAPPPTNNTLNREQRSRLVRSTRKVEAVLGTTPFIVEPDAEFVSEQHDASASNDFQRPDQQVQATVAEGCSPSSSHSGSPMSTRYVNKELVTGRVLPISINLSKTRSNETRTQPLILRLPEQKSNIKSIATGDVVDSLLPSSTTKKPLSPVSFTFNIMNVDTPTEREKQPELSEREKRRKLAKLSRTLGENIPPELVFGPSSTFASGPSSHANASHTSSNSLFRRSLSISFSLPKRSRSGATTDFPKRDQLPPFNKPLLRDSSFDGSVNSIPPLAVAESPRPSLSSQHSHSPAPAPISSPLLPRPEKSDKRKNRPQSLTLGTSSTFSAVLAATGLDKDNERGTTSLDVQSNPQPRHYGTDPPLPVIAPVELPFIDIKATSTQTKSEGQIHGSSLSVEWGRRKEKEWSGEWNLKDMDDVAKKLRGLKRR